MESLAPVAASVGVQIAVIEPTTPRPAFRIQTSDRAPTFVATKLVDLDGGAVQAATNARVR